ncbi:hypothetical protein, partial [Lentzea pudingi]|uniref:hypothetical protein n=1 Tax=Lentzea pudingi TaxID=1789439 RepID=UPI00166CDA2B
RAAARRRGGAAARRGGAAAEQAVSGRGRLPGWRFDRLNSAQARVAEWLPADRLASGSQGAEVAATAAAAARHRRS